MVGQLLLGLSILVGFHECGHMIAAKSFGMRVEKFSIGFPPKLWRKRFGGTEYSIGAIPLGGYVKIAGMIDESLDTASLSNDPEPYEFRAKPAWQRLIVMLGGIIVNVITGILIFTFLAFVNGESYLPKEELYKHGIVAYDLGEQLGFQTGDKILTVNGKTYRHFSDIISHEILLSSGNFFTVERNGEIVRIDMPDGFINKLISKASPIIRPRQPFSVASVAKGGYAEQGGLRKGDRFLSINGQEVVYFDQLRSVLDTLRLETVQVKVLRKGDTLNLSMQISDDGVLGFYHQSELNYTTRKFGFGESVVNGTSQAFMAVWLNLKGLEMVFSGDIDPRRSISGPIKIATLFGGTWNWNRFWWLVGLLSMVLAFMNLLPIPALDGGHVMFLAWEIVTGRKPSDRFLEGAQKIGMLLLLSLMALIIINDTISLF